MTRAGVLFAGDPERGSTFVTNGRAERRGTSPLALSSPPPPFHSLGAAAPRAAPRPHFSSSSASRASHVSSAPSRRTLPTAFLRRAFAPHAFSGLPPRRTLLIRAGASGLPTNARVSLPSPSRIGTDLFLRISPPSLPSSPVGFTRALLPFRSQFLRPLRLSSDFFCDRFRTASCRRNRFGSGASPPADPSVRPSHRSARRVACRSARGPHHRGEGSCPPPSPPCLPSLGASASVFSRPRHHLFPSRRQPRPLAAGLSRRVAPADA